MVSQSEIEFFTGGADVFKGGVFRIYVTHKIYKKWQVAFYPNPSVNFCRFTRMYYSSEEASDELKVLTSLVPDSIVDLRGCPNDNILEEQELFKMLQDKKIPSRYSQKMYGGRRKKI